jgi:hypothetical protein
VRVSFRYQEALDYLDNLGLLPTSGSEAGDSLSSRVHRFHQLETPVRRVMDDVMLLCMECLQRLHAEVGCTLPHGALAVNSWLCMATV